jgi:hypothetical protein
MFLDPDYVQSVTQSSVGLVSNLATLYGSTAAFTQSTDANKPILSRPDRVENLQLNSETLTTGVWSAIRSTTSANSTTAPDGATTADTLIESVDNATHLLSPSGLALVSGTSYRFSVYAKTKERSQIRMLLSGSTPNTAVLVNTTTCAEVSTTGSPLNKTYTLGADGWCKISFEVAANASGSAYQEIYLANAGAISYLGDGTSGIYLWGAQLQRSSMQPTYIATTTAPVYGSLTGRRMLSLDGTNDTMASASLWGDVFAAGAKTAFVVATPYLYTANQNFLSDNGASYGRLCYHNSSGYIGLRNNDGGVTSTPLAPPSANIPLVLAIWHDGTNIFALRNGPVQASVASGNTVNMTGSLKLGSTGAAEYMNGQLGPIITFNRVLPQPVRDTIRAGLQKFWRVN